jgi:DNA topoisomerase VI subunit A
LGEIKTLFCFYDSKVPLRSLKKFFLEYSFVLSFIGRLELEAMLQKGVKIEIEALSTCSISFLSEEYIPQTIKQERYL